MRGLFLLRPTLEVSRLLLGRQVGDSVLGLLQRCLVRRFLLGCHGRWLRGLLLGWLHGFPLCWRVYQICGGMPSSGNKAYLTNFGAAGYRGNG